MKLTDFLKVFKHDQESLYTLTKTKAKRVRSGVDVHQTITGYLDAIERNGDLYILVGRGFDYIRTSPVVKIIKKTKFTLRFETEGGEYLLKW